MDIDFLYFCFAVFDTVSEVGGAGVAVFLAWRWRIREPKHAPTQTPQRSLDEQQKQSSVDLWRCPLHEPTNPTLKRLTPEQWERMCRDMGLR